ncbi:MAG: hypothetical protein OXN81_21005, partial [Alphaproteobacteria bacterium]|nr:hypothetical protein [Alphaproteobacteria bacterium]
MLNGVPLTVTARLLRHSGVRMTMRYAYVGDSEIEAAAERDRHLPELHQRRLASTPTVCSGAAASLSLRVACKPKERSGAL